MRFARKVVTSNLRFHVRERACLYKIQKEKSSHFNKVIERFLDSYIQNH